MHLLLFSEIKNKENYWSHTHNLLSLDWFYASLGFFLILEIKKPIGVIHTIYYH